MRPAVRRAKAGALAVAILGHAALALAFGAPDAPLSEGASGDAAPRLGNAFQDMAAGTLAAVQASDTTPETLAEALTENLAMDPPLEPRKMPEPAASTTRDTLTPQVPVTAATQPVKPQAAQEQTIVAALSPQAALPIAQAAPTVAAENPPPSQITPDQAATPTPSQSRPSPVARATRSQPQTVTAIDPVDAAPTSSPRPRPRNTEVAVASQSVPKPKTTAKPSQARDGAEQQTRAGEATGTPEAQAPQASADGRQQQAGNAAASNYPGLVMRQLSRARKPAVDAGGAAVVAFTIAGNGALASVTLARSSGSDALDRAAVGLVRAAGPFPKPPPGVNPRFSVQIKGR